MNRKLKFRAWDKGHNKMSYKVNLYSMNPRGEMDKAQIDNKQIMNSIGFNCEVMQWTGKSDINGKDIFEHDTVIVKIGKKKINHNGYVIWDDGSFIINLLGSDWFDLSGEIEVTGNIYENPEFLKL